MTGEDLGLKPNTVGQARFEYSPLSKFFNKRLKEEDKKEGLLKRLKNIENKNEEQLKAIEDQREVQTKIICTNKIKPPLLKSIYTQDVKNRRVDNDEAKRIFKILEYMEGKFYMYYKTDCSKLVYRSGENEYFDFTKFGQVSSFYLKLVNGNIGVNVAKLSMNEFKNEIDRRKKKKAKKSSYKINKKDVLENAEALYSGLNIIVDAFERLVFKQTVLKDQIKSKIGIEHTRSENLVNTVEDILDSVIK